MSCSRYNAYHDGREAAGFSLCSQSGGWRCGACSLINRPKQRICYTCKTKKGECISPLPQEYPGRDPSPQLCSYKSEQVASTDNLGNNEWRVVIIGASRHAKHSVYDLILGEKTFSSRGHGNRCRIGFVPHKGCSINVVDTPALFDSKLKEHTIQREFERMILLLSPGPHVFVHVVDEDDSENDENVLHTYVGLLGEGMPKFTVRLCISRDSKSAVQNDNTLTLPDLCDSQRRLLLDSIENLIVKNGEEHFRHELFVEPQRLFQYSADDKWKMDERLVKKVRDLEQDFERMRHKGEKDSQKIQDLEAELRQYKAMLKKQEVQRRQDFRKRLIDDETLDKVFAGLKIVGSHLVKSAISYVFQKYITSK